MWMVTSFSISSKLLAIARQDHFLFSAMGPKHHSNTQLPCRNQSKMNRVQQHDINISFCGKAYGSKALLALPWSKGDGLDEDFQNDSKEIQIVRLNYNNDFNSGQNSMNYLALVAPFALLFFCGYGVAEAGSFIRDPSGAPALTSYWRYFLSGSISASFSHFVTVPFDVVKTRIQLEPGSVGLLDMGRKILGEEGPKGLLTGKWLFDRSPLILLLRQNTDFNKADFYVFLTGGISNN